MKNSVKTVELRWLTQTITPPDTDKTKTPVIDLPFERVSGEFFFHELTRKIIYDVVSQALSCFPENDIFFCFAPQSQDCIFYLSINAILERMQSEAKKKKENMEKKDSQAVQNSASSKNSEGVSAFSPIGATVKTIFDLWNKSVLKKMQNFVTEIKNLPKEKETEGTNRIAEEINKIAEETSKSISAKDSNSFHKGLLVSKKNLQLFFSWSKISPISRDNIYLLFQGEPDANEPTKITGKIHQHTFGSTDELKKADKSFLEKKILCNESILGVVNNEYR